MHDFKTQKQKIKSFESKGKDKAPTARPIVVRLKSDLSKLRYRTAEHNALYHAAKQICDKYKPILVAYVQYDEITFVIANDSRKKDLSFFDGNYQKILSALSSECTTLVGQACSDLVGRIFTGKCFHVESYEDADVYLKHRQHKCLINALRCARHRTQRDDLGEMFEHLNTFPDMVRYGTFVFPESRYEELDCQFIELNEDRLVKLFGKGTQ